MRLNFAKQFCLEFSQALWSSGPMRAVFVARRSDQVELAVAGIMGRAMPRQFILLSIFKSRLLLFGCHLSPAVHRSVDVHVYQANGTLSGGMGMMMIPAIVPLPPLKSED